MNLFPRPTEFLYSGGGYATLSFVPTFGTMLLGLLAGRIMQSVYYHADESRADVGGGDLHGGGIWIGLVRSVPGCETDLDFELGALEWRALFRLVSGAQFGK